MATNSMDYILNLITNNQQFNAGVNASKFAVNALVSAMATVGVGVSVKGLLDVADQYTTLQARIKVAVGETGNFQGAMAGVYNVAIQTNTSLDATASLFSRVNDVGKQMGLTQQQVLDVTKTINQAIQLGGGSAESSEAAVTQLTQALQSGVLRGDEFNSIMEQAPGIAKSLAASLGVTTGELRKMAENGELSSERVVKALQQQAGAIQKEYSQFPVTVSQALQKIQTAWTRLIGEMDQSKGASAQVSAFLQEVADNLYILKRFFDDAAEGVSWFANQLRSVDAGTLDALRDAAGTAYDAVKELFSVIGTTAKESTALVDDLLKQMLGFMTTTEQAQEGMSGFTKAFQLLNIAIGFLKDGFSGVNIGLKLLVGVFYDTGSAWLSLRSKFSWGEAKDRFIADSNEMAAKARQHYQEAQADLLNFSSAGIAAYQQSQKTQEQLNAEALADKVLTLSEIQAADTKALEQQAANNEKRKQLEQQLGIAKKEANEDAVNEIRTQLTELDEQDSAFTKANIERQEEKLKAAQEYAEKYYQANKTIKDGFFQAEMAANGFGVTVNESNKVIVTSLINIGKAATDTGLAISVIGEKAAQSLGVDLDIAFNRISKTFEDLVNQVKKVAEAYNDLAKRGDDAAKLLSMSLGELLEKAKNLKEIEEVRKLYIQYGKDGKLSAQQVADGVDAVNGKLDKQKDNLDEVSAAFKKFGLMGQQEAARVSAEYEKAFYTLVNSGQASQEQLTEAWNKWQRSIQGTANMAVTNSVEVARSLAGVEAGANRVSSGYSRIGNAAVSASRVSDAAAQQAINSLDEWAAKLDAIKAKEGAGLAGKEGSNALNQLGLQSYTQQQIYDQLKAAGLDEQSARVKASEMYRNKSWAATSFGFGDVPGQTGGNDLTNFNYVNAEIAKIKAAGAGAKATLSGPAKVTNVNLKLGDKTVSVGVDAAKESDLLELLRQAKLVS